MKFLKTELRGSGQKNALFFLLIVLFSSISISGSSNELILVPKGYLSPIDSAKNFLIHQQYTKASQTLESYLQKNPKDHEALYLSLAIYQTRLLDYESYLLESSKFEKTADSIRQAIEKILPQLHGSDSLKCLFHYANTYGGISLIQAKCGRWFEAVKNAVISVTLLKEIRAKDPNCYAAYLGIGAFDYYLGSSLKWVPFVDKKGDKGLTAIKTSLKSQFPYNYGAKNSLCWIYIERKDFKLADSLATSVLQYLPNNTIFLRIKMHLNFRSGAYNKAIENALNLLKITNTRDPVNWSDYISAYTILASSYDYLGKRQDSMNSIETMERKNIPNCFNEIPHTKKNLRIIDDLYQKNRILALQK